MDRRKEILLSLRKLSIAIPSFAPDFGKREVCEAWLEHLADLPSAALGAACKTAVQTLDTFPSVARLRTLAGRKATSDKERAEEIADKIWSSLRIGANNPDRAFAQMGSEAAAVARRLGSWYDLCMFSDVTQESFIKRRWRSAAESYLAEGRSTAPALAQAQETFFIEESENDVD